MPACGGRASSGVECSGEPWRRGNQGQACVTLALLPRPICLPCTVGANLALRRPPGSTCREHGERWGFRCVRSWDLSLGVTTRAVLPSPSQGKGTSTNLPFSLTVENELLNKLSVPAHFAALNGDTLNINLKTGMEVRVSGLGGCGGWDSPGASTRMSVCLFQLWLLSPSDPESLLLQGLAGLPGVPWACSFHSSLLFHPYCSGQAVSRSSPKTKKRSPI